MSDESADPTEITDDDLNELSKTAPNGHWVGCAWDRDDVDYVKRRPCICGQRVPHLVAALRAARERLAAAEALLGEAIFMREYGERPPGAPRDKPDAETWRGWDTRCDVFLRDAHTPAWNDDPVGIANGWPRPTTEEPTE